MLLQYLIDVGELSIQDAHLLLTAADYADWLGKPMRGRAGLTAPESLESLTKLERKKARTMRRDVGKLLDRITALAESLDIELLLARYPDDGICFADWSFGLGRPRDAAAMRRFREVELSMIRAHVVTWDPVTEQMWRAGHLPGVHASRVQAREGCPRQGGVRTSVSTKRPREARP